MVATASSPPSPNAIRQRREQAGLTQAQAAEQVGVHVRSWQKWELGERTMSQPAWRLFLTLTNATPAMAGASGAEAPPHPTESTDRNEA